MGESTKNNIIELGKDVIKLLDPTGISSWGDAYDAIKHIDKKDVGTWANAGVEIIGALPLVGKVGKLGKLGKIVNGVEKLVVHKIGKINKLGLTPHKVQTVVNTTKIPGILLTKPLSKVTKGKSTKILQNGRNMVKGSKVLSSTDDVVLGGSIKKSLASRIAHNSGGDASIFAIPLSFLPINAKYNGWTQANDKLFNQVEGKPDVINLIIYGKSNFKKYDKDIQLNGKPIKNTYYGNLYPKDSIIADRKLKGTMQQANAENFQNTSTDDAIIDSHKFRMSFKPNIVRASDTYDFNPYNLAGKLMNAATRPTWKYPNSGYVTFVQEIPVKYINYSDSTLKTILK